MTGADARPGGAGEDLPRRANPYVGLVPFGAEDEDWFFGRDREQRVIGANLRASRLTLLYGASGVGKSSVLMAAVVPSLRAVVAQDRAAAELEDPLLRAQVRFAVSVFSSWHDSPLHGLMEAVALSVEEATGEPAQRWSPGTPLRDAFAGWLDAVGSLLIVLDQFEEYFLYHPHDDGPGTFAGEFVEVVNDSRLRVNFLVSLREDGLAKLDRFKGRIPRLFDNYLRVGHLDLDAARSAIEGPMTRYNSGLPESKQATIDPELITAVLTQIRTREPALEGPGGSTRESSGANAAATNLVETPLLQLVMHRLWAVEAAGGAVPQLSLDTLEHKLGGTKNIVHQHLEQALDRLADRELTAAVLRPLISPTGTKIAWRASDVAFFAKHPVRTVEPILRELASGEQRILRRVEPPPTEADQSSLYELFHDILAQPALEWCSLREGEGQERERRRERRNKVVRGLALVLGVLTIALIVAVSVAINSRQIAGSRALAASAMAQLPVDPERGLLLAKRAVEGRDTHEATQALRLSLAASRVRARLEGGRSRPCLACDGLVTAPPASAGTVLQELAIAPDGRTVAGIVGQRLQLWQPRAGTAREPAVDVGEAIGIAFTPDARRLLVVGSRRAALMAPDGSDAILLRGRYAGGATSPDGLRVATVGASGVAVWDARDGRRLASLRDAGYASVAFGRGRRLVLQDEDGKLKLWRWADAAPRLLARADSRDYPRDSLPAVYAAAGAFAVESAPTRDEARVVAANGDRLRLPAGTPNDPVTGASISPDGSRIATVQGAKVELWNATTPWSATKGDRVDAKIARRPGKVDRLGAPRRRVAELRHTDQIVSVSFSSDGRLVATASLDGTARVWESSTGELVTELRGHAAGVHQLAFSSRGRYVATVGEDLTIRLWDLGRERTLRGDHPVEAVVPARSGARVAVVEDLGALKIWDTRTARATVLDPFAGRRVPDRAGLHPTSAALAADDRTLLVGYATSGDRGGQVVLLDIDSGHAQAPIDTGAVLHVAVDRGARRAAIVRLDPNRPNEVELWNLRGRRDRYWHVPALEQPQDVAFSPDATRLLVTTLYGGAFVYDVRSRRRVLTLAAGTAANPGPEAFYRAVFSPDGETAAVAGSRDVRLFDSRSGKERDLRLSGHTSLLRSVAFSSDGRRIITAGADATTRVWDARNGTMLTVLRRHAGRVNGAAFLADGSIVSGGVDRAVRLYPCETCGRAQTLLDVARRHLTRPLTARELADFKE